MPLSPTVHGTFEISSGCLCFGHLPEIWKGASVPVQPLQQPRPQRGGTVMVQPIEFNAAALNGTWNVYRLVNDERKPVAWFAAHADVDAQQEADKILRVSGSPYEEDSGSQWNNDKTFAEAVFAINRYDWLNYYRVKETNEEIRAAMDPRGKRAKAMQEEMDEDEDEDVPMHIFTSTWLVDQKKAKNVVMKYYEQDSPKNWPRGAAYLHIEDAEYEFARLGFDDQRQAARSFIFFSTNTNFTETRFEGIDTMLRKFETDDERFWRRIEEGFDFAGIEKVQLWTNPNDDDLGHPLFPPRPPADQLLGPYDRTMHILTAEDIDALRIYEVTGAAIQPEPFVAFVKPWDVPLFDLLNEVLMAHLECRVLPHVFNTTPAEAEELLFPRVENAEHRAPLDREGLICFRNAARKPPVLGLDQAAIGRRIQAFLVHLHHVRVDPARGRLRRSPRLADRRHDPLLEIHPETLVGVTAVVVYLVSEVLELANNCARDNRRKRMVPWDIRLATLNDQELRRIFEYATVFWHGR